MDEMVNWGKAQIDVPVVILLLAMLVPAFWVLYIWVFSPKVQFNPQAHHFANASYPPPPSKEEQAKLAALWANCVNYIEFPSVHDPAQVEELWIRNGDAIAEENRDDSPFPPQFVKGTWFAITAWNPMGRESPVDVNKAQNKPLKQDLMRMRPDMLLNAVGTDEEVSWREEGFAVQFRHHADQAEKALLKLARNFGQAAIFRWHYDYLHRHVIQNTIPAQESLRDVHSTVIVARMKPPSKRHGKVQ
jgi:hypothetical protein